MPKQSDAEKCPTCGGPCEEDRCGACDNGEVAGYSNRYHLETCPHCDGNPNIYRSLHDELVKAAVEERDEWARNHEIVTKSYNRCCDEYELLEDRYKEIRSILKDLFTPDFRRLMWVEVEPEKAKRLIELLKTPLTIQKDDTNGQG